MDFSIIDYAINLSKNENNKWMCRLEMKNYIGGRSFALALLFPE